MNVKWPESLFPVHARTTQKVPPYLLYTPLLFIFLKELKLQPDSSPVPFISKPVCVYGSLEEM